MNNTLYSILLFPDVSLNLSKGSITLQIMYKILKSALKIAILVF